MKDEITLSRIDFETKYISRARYDELKAQLARVTAERDALQQVMRYFADPANYPGTADKRIYQMAIGSEAVTIARRVLGLE